MRFKIDGLIVELFVNFQLEDVTESPQKLKINEKAEY